MTVVDRIATADSVDVLVERSSTFASLMDWIIVLSTLTLLFLSITGIILYIRKRRKKNENRIDNIGNDGSDAIGSLDIEFK